MKTFFSLFALATVATATEFNARQAEAAPEVLTATRVFNSVIQQSPFLVTATTTVVWTQSPSISTSQPPPTEIPTDVPSTIQVTTPANLSSILSA